MTVEGSPSEPLGPREPAVQIEPRTVRRKRLARRFLRVFVATYCVLIVGLWGWMVGDGDRGWVATLILFGPRWICLLPLPLLAIASLALDRRVLWALGAAAVVIVGPIMGFRIHLLPNARGRPTLRVLTCNVEKDVFDPHALATLIEREQPDVVALQEVSSATKFIWPPGWHIVNRDEFIVASRWPVAERERLVRPHRNDFSAVRFTVELPDREVQLFNVHLQSPRPGLEAVLNRNTGLTVAGAGRLKAVLHVRAVESWEASQWIAGFPGPTIVMGDFNMPLESTIYRRCWSWLADAFSTAGWGVGFTKISEKRGWSYGARIDHVLFSQPWRSLRCWVGSAIGSDHLPLLAEFQ
ncbi:MAG: endonuclease/exonuclease/phosphatase family protein [Planctomycetia bacterium]|nr:endonuclease/exonuclease/phosphatase family protein [Planctomycetia bacterium]